MIGPLGEKIGFKTNIGPNDMLVIKIGCPSKFFVVENVQYMYVSADICSMAPLEGFKVII